MDIPDEELKDELFLEGKNEIRLYPNDENSLKKEDQITPLDSIIKKYKNQNEINREINNDNYYIRQTNKVNNEIQISLEQMEIIKQQMEKAVCKIKLFNIGIGTGFFCYIPFPNELHLIPVLFTNHHVLKKSDIIKHKRIDFSIKNDNLSFTLEIDDDTKIYSNKSLDITIVEIKEINILNQIKILEVDSLNNEEPKNKYNQKDIYLIHYSLGNKVELSKGKINDIDENFTIKHSCSSQESSSGGPLLNLLNFKVIGIHKGQSIDNVYNLGTLIKKTIEIFTQTFNENETENALNMNILETNVINIEEEYDINVNYLNENPFFEILKVGNKIAITGFGATVDTFGTFLYNFFFCNSNLSNFLQKILNYFYYKKISNYFLKN